MDKIIESLIILDFFGGRIEGKNNFLKRNLNFDLGKCIKSKIDQKNVGINIVRECTDILIQIHGYYQLNVIELNSFKDEYESFFTPKMTNDPELKKRVLKVRALNKELINKVDWRKIKRIRHKVFTHNLRDKKDNNNLSITTLKTVNSTFAYLNDFVNETEFAVEVYKNIRKEFDNDINTGQTALKEKYKEI